MSSNIGWLVGPDGRQGETWNPMIGCERVSEGCDGCYAVPESWMRSFNPNDKIQAAFDGVAARADGVTDWTGKVNLLAERLQNPFKWRRPRYVFVNSLSDVFYKGVPRDFIARMFAVMALNPRHVFIVLTKRPGRMCALLNDHLFWAEVEGAARQGWGRSPAGEGISFGGHALPNVILGVSVENQRWADLRIPQLLNTPATYRAVSAEPLLGPVDLSDLTCPGCGGGADHRCAQCYGAGRGAELLDLIIVGGESGHKARAMHPGWARDLRDQCFNTSFFFKQWGEWGPAPFVVRAWDSKVGWQGSEEELEVAKRDSEARGATHVHTGNWYLDAEGRPSYQLHEIGHKPWSLERKAVSGAQAPMRRWGRKRAGSELDGRAWTEMPVAPHAPICQ